METGREMVKEGVGKGRSDVHVGFQHCYTSPDSASGWIQTR